MKKLPQCTPTTQGLFKNHTMSVVGTTWIERSQCETKQTKQPSLINRCDVNNNFSLVQNMCDYHIQVSKPKSNCSRKSHISVVVFEACQTYKWFLLCLMSAPFFIDWEKQWQNKQFIERVEGRQNYNQSHNLSYCTIKLKEEAFTCILNI